MWDFARDIQERAAPIGQVRREERADVQLVYHEVMELRRDVARLVPGEVGSADYAIAGKRRRQLPRVGIAFETRAAVSSHMEHVAVPVAYARDEAEPVTMPVAIQQARFIPLPLIEFADHVHGLRVR